MTRTKLQSRSALEAHQLSKLRQLIGVLIGHNRFYGDKLRGAGLDENVAGLNDFTARMPFTTKQQIADDQLAHPPYGSNLSFPLEQYTRLSQTSGTTDAPLRWLDTADGWQWMLDNWTIVLDAAAVTPADRAMFAFSFGPFLGFWTAFEAACQKQLLSIPGGGMSSAARLQMILDNQVTILFCTPTYAIHLAHAATEQGLDLARSQVRTIMVAGEPGGSVPATRAYIQQLWHGARVFDHHGMTEVGPVSYENPDHPGTLHVIEEAYLAEIVDPEHRTGVEPGQIGELILTTLGRHGSPLLRYRSGDLVRRSRLDSDTLVRSDLALDGGILGRTDDMILVRGANVFPGAVDQIVRAEPHVAEYRVDVSQGPGLTQMRITIEPVGHCPDPQVLSRRLAAALQNALYLRVPVALAGPGELPRFEMKAKRWIRTSLEPDQVSS